MKMHFPILSLTPFHRKGYALVFVGIALLCGIAYTPAVFAQTQITVNTGTVIVTGASKKYGINVNAGADLDANRPAGARPLWQALQDMGVKHIRFPGGQKSMYYSWASPPYNDPTTQFWVPGSSYANLAMPGGTLNFDQFMTICNKIGATPHVNVPYNPAAGLGPELAAAWVRYSNITKSYGVKNWEIGNEMWNNLGLTTQDLINIVRNYSRAMKAVDPTIKVGISGYGGSATKQLIDSCGSLLDFVTISNYESGIPALKSYTDYKNASPDMCKVDESLSKKTVASEYNVGGRNETGQGIINFDMTSQLLMSPKADHACYWTSRWFWEMNDPKHKNWSSGVYALDAYNNLTPKALPLKLYAMFLKDKLVKVTNTNQSLPTYASYDSESGTVSVFVINKWISTPQSITLKISSTDSYTKLAQVWQYKGKTPNDTIPTLSNLGTTAVSNKTITNYSLPPLSITAFVFTATKACTSADSTIEKTIYEGSSYIFDGRTLTTSGTYSKTVTKTNGCDSLVTLNLTVLPTQTINTTASIADGDSLVFGNQVLKTSGSYTETFLNKQGRDSTVNLTLTVGTSTGRNENILEVESGENGNISVYPVPANNRLIIETGHENVRLITIVNEHGVEVLRTAVNKNGHIELDIERLASGIYVLIMQTATQRRTFRIVKH